VTAHRYRLGAEELIELGNGKVGVNLDRRPFLAGRQKSVHVQLGASSAGASDMLDLLGEVAPYLGERLSMGILALSEILNAPTTSLAASADQVAQKVSGLLGRVTSVKNLLAQIQVLGGVFAKYGLSIPELRLQGLGNILAGIGRELKKAMEEGTLQSVLNGAKKAIAEQGPSELKGAVMEVLNASGVTGDDPAPNVNLVNGVVTPDPVGTGRV
jgi:hypothetical protein